MVYGGTLFTPRIGKNITLSGGRESEILVEAWRRLISSPLFHDRFSAVAVHSGLCVVVWSGAWGRDLAQECSLKVEPIEMCSYVHAFVIRLVVGSPRPVTTQSCKAGDG